MNKFYITTTLPYVNAAPHLGFAMEIVQADVIARYHRLLGKEVVFNTGTDEHGLKIYQAALAQKKDPQKYVDEYAAKFDSLKQALNLSYTNFIRTTNPDHKVAAQEFWQRCLKKGDIYKQNYKVRYCVGCELEKTDSDLEEGRCPIHPTQELEIREEENYFFKWSKYKKALLKLYETNPQFVIPKSKFTEIKQFVSGGLNDFSISRLKSKMPWGVPVPNDPDHVMYVWFDALVNYISTIGWPKDDQRFKEFWPGVQVAGKDNLRQQTAMWQAMLMSAGLPNSKQILIHGHININGQKMSKSLGNVIDPFALVKKYGIDAVRFFILHDLHPFEDSDVTPERIQESYTANLCNGLGNLVSRVAKLCEQNNVVATDTPKQWMDSKVEGKLQEFKFNEAIGMIWSQITEVDRRINQESPWKLSGSELNVSLEFYVHQIQTIALNLRPFMPETAEKILSQFTGQIKSVAPLFPRI